MNKADELLRRLFNEAFMAETIEECRAYLNEKPHEPFGTAYSLPVDKIDPMRPRPLSADPSEPAVTTHTIWNASPPHAAAEPERVVTDDGVLPLPDQTPSYFLQQPQYVTITPPPPPRCREHPTLGCMSPDECAKRGCAASALHAAEPEKPMNKPMQSYRFALQVIAAGEASDPAKMAREALNAPAAEPQSVYDDVWLKWNETIRNWVGHGPSPYEAFCAGHSAARASPSAQPIALTAEQAQWLRDNAAELIVCHENFVPFGFGVKWRSGEVFPYATMGQAIDAALKSVGKE